MRHDSGSQWVPSAVAQRRTGLSRRAVDALRDAGIVRAHGASIHAEDLEMLIRWKSREFVSGHQNIDPSQPVGFAVPLVDPELSPHLELSAANGHALAVQAATSAGHAIGPDQILTGWWSCSQDMINRLVNDRAPILGVTGGLVVEGAWIDAHVATSDYRRRRAFLATRMSEAELDQLRGFVKVNQSGTFINL